MSTRTWYAVRGVLTVIVVAGLAIDAYVHLDLASPYDGVKSSVLTQGDLFRAESGLAILAAVLLLARLRRYTAAFAFLVALAGIAAVLVYQYIDIGAFGPFPDMYDPIWSSEKALSAWGEGIAAAAALALLAAVHVRNHGRARDAAAGDGSTARADAQASLQDPSGAPR